MGSNDYYAEWNPEIEFTVHIYYHGMFSNLKCRTSNKFVCFMSVLQEFCGTIVVIEGEHPRWFMEQIQVICEGEDLDYYFGKDMALKN